MTKKIKLEEVTINELKRVKTLLQEGVQIDGGHHKQWYLEQIAKALGVRLPEHDGGYCPMSIPKVPLGAAGCFNSVSNSWCSMLIQKGDYEYFSCRIYGVLTDHHSDEQPWRAEACGEQLTFLCI